MAASDLIAQGAKALVSFGLAGGLDPALRPGAVVIPSAVVSDRQALPADAALAGWFGGFTDHKLLGGFSIVVDPAEKQRLFAQSGAHAVDLESAPVARIAQAHGLPFLVVRAICDPAERGLPPAALVALDAQGGIGFGSVLRSIMTQPGQIPGLVMLARDAANARRALVDVVRRFKAAPGS